MPNGHANGCSGAVLNERADAAMNSLAEEITEQESACGGHSQKSGGGASAAKDGGLLRQQEEDRAAGMGGAPSIKPEGIEAVALDMPSTTIEGSDADGGACVTPSFMLPITLLREPAGCEWWAQGRLGRAST